TFVGSIGANPGAGATTGAEPAGAAPMELSHIEGLEPETEGTDHQALLRELHALRAAVAAGAGGRIWTPRPNPKGPPSVRGLTPQQVREHMEKGLCFKCGIAGHQSR